MFNQKNTIKSLSIAALLMFTLTGCVAPTKNSQHQFIKGEHHAIQDVLPTDLAGFSYVNSITYPEPWGYSLRYRNNISHRTYSDIYIYPAPKEADSFTHEEIVYASTNEALSEIEYAKEQGAYSEFKVLSKSTFTLNGRMATRVEIYLVKDNLVSYSLLFVTASNGKLIKARMTMPDNDNNRSNESWSKFVTEVFSIILNNIEQA